MSVNSNVLGLCAIVSTVAAGAQAQDLLIVDLSVANQLTITATGNAASASAAGDNFTGVLLADFYSGAGANLGVVAGTGDFTAFGATADNSPSLFRGNGGADLGLNIWSFSLSSFSFSAGQTAFSGSGTWSLDAATYADMVNGNQSGTIYSPADTDDDIAGATAIGNWRVIPTPSSLALLGMGGLVAGRRRR